MRRTDPTTISKLLERYFAGETTLAEEKQLRAYFRSGNLEPEHAGYAPLFAYWDEAATVRAPPARPMTPTTRLRPLRWALSAAAAVLLLLLANAWCNRQPERLAGPYAETSFPMKTTPAPASIDWSRFEVSADETGYRALRGALRTASTALNEPTNSAAVRELDKLGMDLRK